MRPSIPPVSRKISRLLSAPPQLWMLPALSHWVNCAIVPRRVAEMPWTPKRLLRFITRLNNVRDAASLNIQVLHVQRIFFDEFTAGFDVFTHQRGKDGLA